MKAVYVRDLLRGSKREGTAVTLLGWIKARRDMGQLVFLDVCDSTGTIQVVVKGGNQDATGEQTAVAVLSDSAVSSEAFTVESVRFWVSENVLL